MYKDDSYCFFHNYTWDFLDRNAYKLKEFKGTTIWKFYVKWRGKDSRKLNRYTALITSDRPTQIPYLVTDDLILLKSRISEAIDYYKQMENRCPHCKRLYD